ncbi:DUF6622 family protein [Variovorax terrae]|uniref:DUF1453 domain-containing protein n=1 Tax=Variovorax terrae TaxID=2923278 RepID=A0A9X2APV5_9BURK|nr:DUF6622 family protein [Variovorax terrae]MCJ0762456.1 hypothetical protein [Variovorax terrae]
MMQILTHTPAWVFGLFAVLLWYGLSQRLARTASLKRTTLLPLAMLGFSGYGVLSAFGASLPDVLSWLATGALAAFVVSRIPLHDQTRYDADSRRFHLPGSYVPLALMMGIFLTKYAVNVALATHPALGQDTAFALLVCTLYGAFSGIFTGRALRLWKLAAQESDRAPSLPRAA